MIFPTLAGTKVPHTSSAGDNNRAGQNRANTLNLLKINKLSVIKKISYLKFDLWNANSVCFVNSR